MTSKADLGQLTNAAIVYPHTVRDVVTEMLAQRGQAIVMFGLLLLIATPIARVAFSVGAFIVERDRIYIGITILVLLLLLISLIAGAE